MSANSLAWYIWTIVTIVNHDDGLLFPGKRNDMGIKHSHTRTLAHLHTHTHIHIHTRTHIHHIHIHTKKPHIISFKPFEQDCLNPIEYMIMWSPFSSCYSQQMAHKNIIWRRWAERYLTFLFVTSINLNCRWNRTCMYEQTNAKTYNNIVCIYKSLSPSGLSFAAIIHHYIPICFDQ